MFSKYQPIYDEMRDRNHALIEKNSLTFDSALQEDVIDPRKGLGVFALFGSNTERFESIIQEARELFSRQVIYSPNNSNNNLSGNLHVTLFQFFKVDSIPEDLTEDVLREYQSVLKEVFSDVKPFEILYKGMIAVPGNIVLCGYPSIDINKIREKIRILLNKKHLPYKEPYKADTVHSTFIRFSRAEEKSKVISFVEKYQDINLGTYKFDKIFFNYGTWKMNPEETKMIYEFDLGNKTTKKL